MPSFISFIPTPQDDISYFFDLVEVGPSDVVYDLGAGDGRLLFGALDRGAGRAVGVELDPERIQAAREKARAEGYEERVAFIEADVLDVNLADATVIFCYLSAPAAAALKPKFESELKPGTRVVMETFPVIGWKPAQTKGISEKTAWWGFSEFYLYIMPPERT